VADGLEVRYERTFIRSQYEWAGLALASWWGAMWTDFRNLQGLPCDRDPAIYFCHSTTFSELVPVLAWAHLRLGKRSHGYVVALLRYRPGYPYRDESRRTRFCARMSKALLRGHLRDRVKLVTDSESLAREYECQLGVRVTTLPIPHSPPVAATDRNRGITIGYIGASRVEKGYALLPDVLKRIYQHDPHANVIVQSQMDSVGSNTHPDPFIADAYDKLCALQAEHPFRHIKNTLGQAEFNELIGSIDILLLPHQAEGYANQTSGIFSDALAAGCIPITTRGTWLATQLAAVPSEYRPVVDYTAEAVAQGVKEVSAKITEYRNAFASLSKAWSRANSARELIRRVIAQCA
jgi:glycosyltransferase involved in cell wall biosynthesis